MRSKSDRKNEQGSATIIALLVMALMMAFVALAVSRTTTETLATSNDEIESRTFSAAQASLENATRNFDQIFESKLTPTATDLADIRNSKPTGFETDFDFVQDITQTENTKIAPAGSFLQGLTALRDEWRVDTTVTHKATGVQVALRRKFFNDRVPIFQFGIFYNDDLEFHPGPRFDFGGRVHSNANMFLMADTGLYFSSKVTAAGQIITDVARNGRASTDWGNNVYVRNGAGTYVQLSRTMGSALNTVANGPNLFATTPPGQLPLPAAYRNTNWTTYRDRFQGNLLSEQKRLDLPLKISSALAGDPMDYIELIKRSKLVGDKFKSGGTNTVPIVSNVAAGDADGPITTKERYANKTGIRVSLANTRDRLPGCASVVATSPCGVRLDGPLNGQTGAAPATGAGYLPKKLTDGTQSSQVNGLRMNPDSNADGQDWIKIETVQLDTVTGNVNTVDITEDMLALGVTERAPRLPNPTGNAVFEMDPSTYDDDADRFSIFKIQRYMIQGVALRSVDTAWMTTYTNSGTYNLINAGASNPANASSNVSTRPRDYVDNSAVVDEVVKKAKFRDTTSSSVYTRDIAAFPIKMFDTREGLYNDSLNINNTFGAASNTYHRLPETGVMSIINIDVANLRAFLMGDRDGLLPTAGTPFSVAKGRGLKASDIPNSNGWVLYVSDRRGDYDFDGEYDGEDIYGPNNGGDPEPGEDVNMNGQLDTNYTQEAPRYNTRVEPEEAAVVDTRYYRRGVRLINGSLIPGNYDSSAAATTRGFTLASENGVYVQGNYNATGITGTAALTPPENYTPQNTVDHIPASVAGDSVTILSRAWDDGRSFRYPFSVDDRKANETTIRFAILTGDAISSLEGSPNQGGGNPRMTGGVHNFKRFLENWDNTDLHYSGSLINLFNSHNNNGAFKCCTNTYTPPTRDWTFDVSFMDPTRLPPGTPFFQSIELTGFQRLNE